MYQSATGKLQPLSSAAFSADECRLLSKCSSSRFIHPGGSQFGDLGDLATSVKQPDSANGASVALTIKTSTQAFWQFEPVELDVCLHAVSRTVRVPDALDIGYSGFEIWITDPAGRGGVKISLSLLFTAWRVDGKAGSAVSARHKHFWRVGWLYFRRAGVHQIGRSSSLPKGAAYNRT
jgi:hypothetical protein